MELRAALEEALSALRQALRGELFSPGRVFCLYLCVCISIDI